MYVCVCMFVYVCAHTHTHISLYVYNPIQSSSNIYKVLAISQALVKSSENEIVVLVIQHKNI